MNMSSLTDQTINSVLIIGNGFDIHCELNSSFSNYYENICLDIIERFYKAFESENYEEAKKLLLSNNETINFWSFLFYVHYYSDSQYKIGTTKDTNWFDIEQLIKDALTINIKNGFKLARYINNAFEMLKKGTNIRRPENKIARENPYVFYPFFQQEAATNAYDYLFNELRKFEKSFKCYMINIVDSKYSDRSFSFLKKLLNGRDFVDLISFNYTIIDDNMLINKKTNVHGDIYGDEIIIGIDSSSVDSDELINFSKTYRNIHRFKEDIELPKIVEHLLFYGHSLSDADFSYFYSLFDMYKLYDGNLKLEFFYSDYEKTLAKNELNHSKYVKQIYKLINEYSRRKHNESNLLHRLLLEGRIIVKKI